MHFGQLVHIVVIVLIFSLKRTAFASEKCSDILRFLYLSGKTLFRVMKFFLHMDETIILTGAYRMKNWK